ncbi:MAG: tRNA (adenosine(37)-N6)-threonylcarbamoyltransferase complex dimerization subunit type 1 TsaB [Bacteroidota bacterium]
MAFILSIETSTTRCSVALHENGELRSSQAHQVEKSHSSLLPSIVEEILKEAGRSYQDLDAVAVSSGPGSYTGLRIGVTTAKGFCYSLSIPLISVDTLDSMLQAVKGKFKGNHFLCPMLDARRMEVYTKMINQEMAEVWALQAKILDEDSLAAFNKETVYVFGNGMPKFKEIVAQENVVFIEDIYPDASNMGMLAYDKFQAAKFEDTAYFEPNYLKEWRTTTPKKQLI